MGHGNPAAIGQRLFHQFMAPLVLGGELTPGPPVGPRAALTLGESSIAVDPSLRTQVEVARVRVARQLVAIDVMFPPTADEWALGAMLHDVVYALHPGLDSVLHRKAASTLLDGAVATLARILPPKSLHDVVSRHTFFARAFDLHRTDTTVSWWVGSRQFLGVDPPSRLLAWPELRQVRTAKVSHTLAELSSVANGVDREQFEQALRSFLSRTPLTDLATADRAMPAFGWTSETLGLLATEGGRSLGLRALALSPRASVDAALGLATERLMAASDGESLKHAGWVLADRVIAHALSDVGADDGDRDVPPEATYARTLGAVAAERRIAELGLDPRVAARAQRQLLPMAASPLGRQLSDYFLAILGNAAGSAGGSSTSIDA